MADYDILKAVAREKKFDLDSLIDMYIVESSGNPEAVNPLGYTGGFQFGTSAGREYGLVGEGFDYRKNLQKSAGAAIEMYLSNIRDDVKTDKGSWSLSSVYKEHDITPSLAGYITHQQGRTGFIDIITGAKSGRISKETRKNMLANIGDNNWSDLSDKELANKYITFWKKRYASKLEESAKWKRENKPSTDVIFDEMKTSEKDIASYNER